MIRVRSNFQKGQYPSQFLFFSARQYRNGSRPIMTIAPLHFSVKEHTVPCQYIREYPGATLSDQEDTLKLHVKQYKPKDQSQDRPGAVTIIGAHANAFPKVGFT